MKRSYIRRTKPMPRRRKAAPPKGPYRLWLERQPCRHCNRETYGGVHHKNGAGWALRSDDDDGIPMCGTGTTQCHGDFHGLCGGFRGWVKQQLRDWQDEAIRDLHALYDFERECRAS